jgi:zinc transport system substrate-binding protein
MTMCCLVAKHIYRLAAIFIVIGTLAPNAMAAPKVVVSIKPIHALIAGVMAGVGEPGLIVSGAGSPHDYALRPSDATALEQAQLVFWIGPIFESFLVKPLDALAGKATIIELDLAPQMLLLPAREGGAWEEDKDEHATHRHGMLDGHIWLDPENAKAIVRAAVQWLSNLDPENAARYAANGATLERRLGALDDETRQRLAGVRQAPFIVFHDAYHYFERRYQLSAVGSITVTPEHPPSAKRIHEIHRKIIELGARCVFNEKPFEPALVETVIADTPAARGVLDPEGTALAPGPELYFTLMRGLADSLATCLGRSG